MARDPYKYFRVEARELLEGLGRGALELEKGKRGPDIVAEMLRLAHTLKGAARVVGRLEIAEHAHALEELLTDHRHTDRGAVPGDDVDRLLRTVDAAVGAVATLDASAPPVEKGRGTVVTEANAARGDVRVEADQVDALLEDVVAAEVRVGAVWAGLDELSSARGLADSLHDGARSRGATEALALSLARAERGLRLAANDVEREIARVRRRAGELRLVPASTVFAALERSIRDAARSQGREVELETVGGDERLEGEVLAAVRDAMLHVVRNAIAHGIEAPSERTALGKPAVGHVKVTVARRGGRIAFICSDDGRGIDTEGVRRAAVAAGLVSPGDAEGLRAADVHRMVLESGVTTSARVSDVSGRGVGLDVVRATAAKLKGEVRLSSEVGRGTTVDLSVPVSQASLQALVVQAAGEVCALPLDAVRCTLRLAASDIAHAPEGDSIAVDGARVPFLPLSEALGQTSETPHGGARIAALVRSERGTAAIGVDRLIGIRQVTLRAVPRFAGLAPIAAGAALDPVGDPQLVLDAPALVDAAHASRKTTSSAPAPAARAPVLVIDDSLTTRMLEKTILESAGYAVDTATSAEEALVKARSAAYSLFLVDVEMPGMDGFTFVETSRADPALRNIPAVLVTSRSAPEDRRRGEQAGASGYVVKGEFNQAHLLEMLRRLVG